MRIGSSMLTYVENSTRASIVTGHSCADPRTFGADKVIETGVNSFNIYT